MNIKDMINCPDGELKEDITTEDVSVVCLVGVREFKRAMKILCGLFLSGYTTPPNPEPDLSFTQSFGYCHK